MAHRVDSHTRTHSSLAHKIHSPLIKTVEIQSTSLASLLPLCSVSSLLCPYCPSLCSQTESPSLHLSPIFCSMSKSKSIDNLVNGWARCATKERKKKKQWGTVIVSVCKVCSLMDSGELLQAEWVSFKASSDIHVGPSTLILSAMFLNAKDPRTVTEHPSFAQHAPIVCLVFFQVKHTDCNVLCVCI